MFNYICDHRHESSYRCTREGCGYYSSNGEATIWKIEGHWPHYSEMYKTYFKCYCGYTHYYNSDKTFWDDFYNRYDYNSSYFTKGEAAWNEYWKAKCKCEDIDLPSGPS